MAGEVGDTGGGGNIGVPRDSEQIMAEQGLVSDKQKRAAEAITARVASRVQDHIDTVRVRSDRELLQSEFDKRRQIAIAARHQEPTPTASPVKKKRSFLDWLLGR
jgi:hypothetical protein